MYSCDVIPADAIVSMSVSIRYTGGNSEKIIGRYLSSENAAAKVCVH